MNNQQIMLITSQCVIMAIKKYGYDITPVSNKQRFSTCITVYKNVVMFWFNTPDHSTHTIKMELSI